MADAHMVCSRLSLSFSAASWPDLLLKYLRGQERVHAFSCATTQARSSRCIAAQHPCSHLLSS